MYYTGFSYHDAYNIPVWQRIWFIKRINTEMKRSNDANKGQGSSSRADQGEARAMMGRARSMVPSNLRRFS